MNPRYSMVITWSDEDQCFIVSLPEFGPYANTHGDNTFYIRAVDRSGNSSAPSKAIKLFLWPC